MISAYLPSAAGLLGLAATLIVFAAVLGIGKLALPAEGRPEALFVAGYGLVLVVVTALGTATMLPLTWLYVVFLVLGVLGFLWFLWRRGAGPVELGIAVLLTLPLLLLMAGSQASQWDEFSNWLPKIRYLLEFDRFPRIGMPRSLSQLPAYPDGLPLVAYFISRTTGFFVENAGALFNSLLIAVAGLLVMRCASAGATGNLEPRALSWRHLAIGLLAVTLLNPTFVPKLVLTAYLDWTTSVLLAMVVVGGWRVVEALVAENPVVARREAIIVGLALAVLIDLKQPNLILALLALIGCGLAALRTPTPQIRALLRLWPAIIVPAAIAYFTWRFFVLANFVRGEFLFLPFDEWLWDYLWVIAVRMALIASTKGGYFGLMAILTAVAVRSWLRPAGPFGRLAIIVATIFVGYNAFLYVAYVGAFGLGEGPTAASYWRYNTQLGVLGVAAAAYGLGMLWRRRADHAVARWIASPAAGAIAVALVLVGPFTQPSRLRFDINPARDYVRGIGAELATLLPPGSRLATIDRLDNGEWAFYIRYEVGRTAVVRGLSGAVAANASAIRDALAEDLPPATHVWVHVPEPAIEAALGVPLAPKTSYLLERAGDTWRLVKSWPWPGYDDPHRYDK
jgi:hypothetical protein